MPHAFLNFSLVSDSCFSSDSSGIFERNSADRMLSVAPVSNKALVVIVFPITIGILQSWWITYCAGAKKNKGFIKGSITLENENSSSISDYNGRMVLFDYPVFIEIQDLYKIYNNITIDDINRVIAKYFRKELMCVYLIGDIDDTLRESIREECSKLLQ